MDVTERADGAVGQSRPDDRPVVTSDGVEVVTSDGVDEVTTSPPSRSARGELAPDAPAVGPHAQPAPPGDDRGPTHDQVADPDTEPVIAGRSPSQPEAAEHVERPEPGPVEGPGSVDGPAPGSVEGSGPVEAPAPIEGSGVGPCEPAVVPDPEVGGDLRQVTRLLRGAIASLPLDLDVPSVAAARRERELMLAQLDDYLLPRLARMDAPLLAVIGGSTGAGKSTLTNSLARKTVSRSGVLRPTTRSPVLVHHPHDSGAFLTQRILPDLARITSEALEPLQPVEVDAPRITALRLVPHDGLSPGLALLDAPDIDSVVEANRELAVQLLGAADLWLFVTTATRYGDAMPWEMLRTAVQRGVSVAVILDRVPAESLQEVRVHLARRLSDRGLGAAPMFVIPELALEDGLLPEHVVVPLHRWLNRLAKDSRARDVVVRRTLAGILESLPARVGTLVSAASEQETAAQTLGTELDAVFATARSAVGRHLVEGDVLRGEVLARWQEVIGNGELIRHLERTTGRFSHWVNSVVRKPPLPTEPLREALTAGARAIVGSGVREAVEQALARWQELAGGAGLATDREVSKDLDERIRVMLDDWHAQVLDSVRNQPNRPDLAAGPLCLGPELTTVLVEFAGFAEQERPAAAGPAGEAVPAATRAEPRRPIARRASGRAPTWAARSRSRTGAPAGATVPAPEEPASTGVADGLELARRVLEAVYGQAAVRALVDSAQQDLRLRVEDLLNAERSTLKALLAAARIRPGQAEALLAAVKAVDHAR